MTRRLFLHVTAALGALAAAVAAGPSLLFWWRTSRREVSAPDEWVDVGSPHKLPDGEWQNHRFTLERQNRWRQEVREELIYVRRVDRDITVLSPVCPHARCLVHVAGSGFSCGCHRSAFDDQGRVLGGPAPRPLDPLEWKVERGRLLVRYQQFKPGLARPEALGT